MKIALAGNPNSGKTTLFNALTGSTQYVGNWPGVTVEKKDGKLKSADFRKPITRAYEYISYALCASALHDGETCRVCM